MLDHFAFLHARSWYPPAKVIKIFRSNSKTPKWVKVFKVKPTDPWDPHVFVQDLQRRSETMGGGGMEENILKISSPDTPEKKQLFQGPKHFWYSCWILQPRWPTSGLTFWESLPFLGLSDFWCQLLHISCLFQANPHLAIFFSIQPVMASSGERPQACKGISWVVATHIFFGFHPGSLGKMNPIWRAYFSKGWFNHQLPSLKLT